MSSSPQPSRAEAQSTGTVAARSAGRHAASQASAAPRLLTTTAKGMPAAARRAAVSFSTASQQGPSSTSRATSTRRMARRLRSTRRAPSGASRSSSPAVSRKTTGPRGAISSVFSTGSAVLPGVGETMATSWPTSALSREDLPALRRPNRPMCRRRALGLSFMPNSFMLAAGHAGRHSVTCMLKKS